MTTTKKKKIDTRYLLPKVSNFERMLRLAAGLSHEETITLIKALYTGLGNERLYTQSEVQRVVEQALVHQHQREPFLRGVENLPAELRKLGVR